MSIEAMKMALEALENIGRWLPTIGQKGLRDYEADAIQALRQAIEQAEKPWVKTYCGGKPNYCTPVDAVNISQERVDEIVKGGHEPVAWMKPHLKCDASCLHVCTEGFAKFPQCVQSKREWVGLTDEEVKTIVNDNTSNSNGFEIWCNGAGVARAIEAKLKEKNT